MGVVFIGADDTLSLRSIQLRNGIDLEECRMDSDIVPGIFHLGYYEEGKGLVSVLSCVPNDHPTLKGQGYRLRGVATHPDYLGMGFGKQLISFCVARLKEKNVDYLWCNARQIAYPFYTKIGFEFLSDEFEIQGIGLHREMGMILSSSIG